MGRLFEGEQGHCFTPDEELIIPLNENNLMANLHRDADYMDRVGIEDPTDEAWWLWFRADTDPESFDTMVQLAHTIGTVLLRSSPLSQVEAQFEVRHTVEDEEIEQFWSDNGTAETE